MKPIDWLSEFEFVLDGVRFQCCVNDYTQKTNAERFILLKDRSSLEQYATVLGAAPPKNILEFGVFQGGSPALYTLWFELDKFVGVDICDPVQAFEEFRRTHAIGKKIRPYYGVSQADKRRVEEIVRAEFADAPLDVVIDDASHRYDLTRRTFEIAFPLLRPGGVYVIEDWGWAHWPGHRGYEGQTAMSMLIMELVMLCASKPELVSDIRIFPAFAFIRKAPEAKPLADFELSALYGKRGVELMGEKHLNLRGVAGLLADRLAHSTRRELDRFARRRRRRRQGPPA